MYSGGLNSSVRLQWQNWIFLFTRVCCCSKPTLNLGVRWSHHFLDSQLQQVLPILYFEANMFTSVCRQGRKLLWFHLTELDIFWSCLFCGTCVPCWLLVCGLQDALFCFQSSRALCQLCRELFLYPCATAGLGSHILRVIISRFSSS